MKIVALETVKLEGRSGYYDSIGALKDMVQSHFLNIAFSTLDNPKEEFENFKVIEFKKEQYEGYREDLGKESDTETYVYLHLQTKNYEYIFETGKGFQKNESYIELDDKRLNLADSNPYIKLFKEFLDNKKDNFAKIETSILAWEIIEKVTSL